MENQNTENQNSSFNMKNPKTIIAIVAAVVIVIALIVIAVNNNSNSGGTADTSTVEATERPRVTPTFMYFVSSADEGYDDTQAMLAELEAEYGESIKFDIRNVDDDPEMAENYSVTGQTPALIMLDVYNDISAFAWQCNDKELLISYIEAALNK